MKAPPEVRSLTPQETQALLKRAETNTLAPEDVVIIRQTLDTLGYIISLLHQKKTPVKSLLKLIFGIKSEKSQKSTGASKSKDLTEKSRCRFKAA